MSLADVLFATLPNPLYLGLFYQDPGQLHDPLTVELTDPAYVRHTFAWTRVGNSLTVASSILFTGIQSGTQVVAMGLLDDYTNGHLRFSEVFSAPYHFTKGGTLLFNGLSVAVPN